MARSRADRILAEWDEVSRRARPPGPRARVRVSTAMPLPTIALAAVILIVAVAMISWLGRTGEGPRFGAEPTTSTEPTATPPEPTATPPEPAATPVDWGPLAVMPPDDGADQARNEGTLRITDRCVFLERGGEATILTWNSDEVTWNAGPRTIAFRNYDGTVITVGDGDYLELG